MSSLGILYLPSGPGMNAGPAKGYLDELFTRVGPTLFWSEPSARRGDRVPADDGAVWDGLVASLEAAVNKLPPEFVIVTESFGSILAEVLYARLVAKGEGGRVRGMMHSPPVLDLFAAFRQILAITQASFQRAGDLDRARRQEAFLRELDADPRIDSPALHRGVVLGFESPDLFPTFFRSPVALNRWAGGMGTPGYAPEPEMRDRILRGMGARGAPTRTTFAPDLPTTVVGGGSDPYHSILVFVDAVARANALPRKHPVHWVSFAEASHYPYVDAFERWRTDAWLPFLASATQG